MKKYKLNACIDLSLGGIEIKAESYEQAETIVNTMSFNEMYAAAKRIDGFDIDYIECEDENEEE